MKLPLYIAGTGLLFPLMLSCGGGGGMLTLTVLPPATTLNVDTGIYTNVPYVQLQPRFSNGTTPSGVRWSSSAACVPVNTTGQVDCNISCAGVIKSTVVASAGGVSGSATVTCDYHTSVSIEPQPALEKPEVREPGGVDGAEPQ